MTYLRASISALTHHRHGLATAALAALVLTGCGSELSGGDLQGEQGRSVVSETSPTRPSPEQAAFAAMLNTFAQACPPTEGTAPRPTYKKPAGPEGTQSLAPGESPPADPIEPGAATGPAAELNARDWCASGHHEQRIIEALQKVAEPTPAKVRKTLNGLGYIDERIHGLKQDGKTTRFYLDLRENGGQLCEVGLAAGEVSDVNKCVVPASGPFAVKTEEQP